MSYGGKNWSSGPKRFSNYCSTQNFYTPCRGLHLLSNSLAKSGKQPLKPTCPGIFSLAPCSRADKILISHMAVYSHTDDNNP